ncbi:hypothetical protein CK203_026349 [Vitis vinifera]|uniref:Uncharacterized protein n=1 Tax=Vitis vinifera TaxID=29760 RepID=A0A438IKZ9_VITVI|nr:hypothetical protein CK203_026349 [Vitis vinifera]
MQSDLDMASASLSKQLHDLDLLLRSGVLRQSNAIVLSQPGPGSAKEDLGFFVRDLFTRLQIGGIEFKKKALESLLQLLADDEKAPVTVAKEGEGGNCRGGYHCRSENAWAVSAYGGVSILIEACRSATSSTQTHAVGALRNVAVVEDIRNSLGEEGAVPILVQLLASGSGPAQEKAANCIAILASSGEYFRALIIQERGLLRLMQLLHDSSSSEALEHVLRTLISLSASDSISRSLSSSTAFIIQLSELIKHGNIILQHSAASLLAHLSISDGNKRAIASCLASLVKLMESSKPVGLQEVAAQALVSLLAVRSNRKELVRDEKSVMRLMQMLDPKKARRNGGPRSQKGVAKTGRKSAEEHLQQDLEGITSKATNPTSKGLNGLLSDFVMGECGLWRVGRPMIEWKVLMFGGVFDHFVVEAYGRRKKKDEDSGESGDGIQ